MNTIITLTANGNVAPNEVIDLGFKNESVGDTITFIIPKEYRQYHHYLVFSMKKLDTILLPVNWSEDGENLSFKISTTITRNPGTYQMVFVSTENQVVGGDVKKARKVFVSNIMLGLVKNNFLNDPVVDEGLDPNLQVLYDSLLDLKADLDNKVATDFYRGAAYIPNVDPLGIISWTRTDGENILIPEPVDIKGPTGNTGDYFVPVPGSGGKEGVIAWLRQTYDITQPEPPAMDLKPLIDDSTNVFLRKNLKPLVDAGIDAKLKWEWDAANQMLYITAEEGHDKEVTP